MRRLVACPGCDRHLHDGERECPFCGADARASVSGAVRPVSRRELTRAAIFFAGAALVASSCSNDADDETVNTNDDTGGGENEEGDGVVDDHSRDRDRRRNNSCDDPSCMAMPYGAPDFARVVF